MDAQNFLRYRRIKNTSLLSSLCACFSDAVVKWPCDVIAASHFPDMNVFNSYLQLELCRKNIWHAGHHKAMANFKSVAYVQNRCRSTYNCFVLLIPGFVTALFNWSLVSPSGLFGVMILCPCPPELRLFATRHKGILNRCVGCANTGNLHYLNSLSAERFVITCQWV